MELITIQRLGIDITKNTEPTKDYTTPGEPYYDLAQFLGWAKWVWCLKDMAAFERNDYLTWKGKGPFCLWVLDVPEHACIVWASLEKQCSGEKPESFLYPRWEDISSIGHTPMALLESPIEPAWVVSKWIIEQKETANPKKDTGPLSFIASNGCEFVLDSGNGLIDISNLDANDGIRLPVKDIPRFIHELKILFNDNQGQRHD